MLAGMCGNIVFMLAFGLAPTYPTAVLFRFLQGLSSGNVIVVGVVDAQCF
jgi:MFS family permease